MRTSVTAGVFPYLIGRRLTSGEDAPRIAVAVCLFLKNCRTIAADEHYAVFDLSRGTPRQ